MSSDKLSIVMPVYNECEAIEAVLLTWTSTLDDLNIDYHINCYNDGSKDNSLYVMQKIAAGNSRIIVHDKQNSGHGPTILQAYRESSKNYDWIFQIDSDNEMGPEEFHVLWNKRNDYDFLLGVRDGRKQPLPRKIISMISRLAVYIFYKKSVWDVNSPYRLMRKEEFKNLYAVIPDNTFAPNVIISGYVGKGRKRYFEYNVDYRDRQTGEVSIKKWKLFKAALKSFLQTIRFAFICPRN